ncbi:MAG: FAD-binding oxidoreductase [Mangrovicoccus sp.]
MSSKPPVSGEIVSAALAILKQRFGPRLDESPSMREQHGHTTTWLPNQPPEAVVFAESTQEVQDIVKICAARRVPIIPFGAGTSLEGHLNAPMGGVSLDLSRMNEVVEINIEDMDCRVQPGVTRSQLNTELRATGLFFPVDPGADATIGGMAATRASGTNAVRYGTMRDAVLSAEVVTAKGDVIRTASRARKSSAGYDLTRLMVGSEGTLGIMTELTLRLHGQPEAVAGAICSFPTISAAATTVAETILMGIPVARIEFLDTLGVKAVNAYSKLSLPEAPLLLLELHGTDSSIGQQAQNFAALAKENGALQTEWSTNPEERTRLWKARHDAYWACLALRPGAVGVVTDVCVPVSALPDCVSAAQDQAEAMGLLCPIVGHVGDGNFHALPLVDPASQDEKDLADRYVAWLNDLAISHGGTCTGEHGVGQGKAKYLEKELGAGALDMMTAIKQALDPDNILNPGKILLS